MAQAMNYDNAANIPLAGQATGKDSLLSDAGMKERLREVKRRAREAELKNKKLTLNAGKLAANKLKREAVQNPGRVFGPLLFIAIFVDLAGFIDMGVLTTFVNMGIYALSVMIGFLVIMLKQSSNRFSLINILKGQLWKYAVLPLLELVPVLNLLPFWTLTVVMMWLKVKFTNRA